MEACKICCNGLEPSYWWIFWLWLWPMEKGIKSPRLLCAAFDRKRFLITNKHTEILDCIPCVRRAQTNKQTDGWTDECYQTYYLPCLMVDKYVYTWEGCNSRQSDSTWVEWGLCAGWVISNFPMGLSCISSKCSDLVLHHLNYFGITQMCAESNYNQNTLLPILWLPHKVIQGSLSAKHKSCGKLTN